MNKGRARIMGELELENSKWMNDKSWRFINERDKESENPL